jgi:hypothetical protein
MKKRMTKKGKQINANSQFRHVVDEIALPKGRS